MCVGGRGKSNRVDKAWLQVRPDMKRQWWGGVGGGGGAVPRGKGGGTLYERVGHAYIVICTTT